MKIRKRILSLASDEEGVTLVEYGVALTLAVALGGPAILVLAGTINGSVNAAANQMPA